MLRRKEKEGNGKRERERERERVVNGRIESGQWKDREWAMEGLESGQLEE